MNQPFMVRFSVCQFLHIVWHFLHIGKQRLLTTFRGFRIFPVRLSVWIFLLNPSDVISY
jgi:hypothetical protein